MKKFLFTLVFIIALALLGSNSYAFETGEWDQANDDDGLYGYLKIEKDGNGYKVDFSVDAIIDASVPGKQWFPSVGYSLNEAKAIEKNDKLLIYHNDKPALSIENKDGLAVKFLVPLKTLPHSEYHEIPFTDEEAAKIKWVKRR